MALTTPFIWTLPASCLLCVKLSSIFFQLYKYYMFIEKNINYTDEQREEIVPYLSPKENHCGILVCVLADVCVCERVSVL